MSKQDKLHTVRSAASILGVSPQRVHALINAGRLPTVPVSTAGERPYLILRESEVERFKADREADKEAVQK